MENESVPQVIIIPHISLDWSNWFPWERFLIDYRSNKEGIRVPDLSGVYEVKNKRTEEILTIGKASNLRMRLKQALVKGMVPHSSGKDIRKLENTSEVIIRWAKTDRPSAVEEELHKMYKENYGKLPKYTDRT